MTAEEQLRGRFSVIRQASQAKQAEGLVQAYRKLRDTLDDLKQFYILDFTPAAFVCYETLLKQKLRVGTQDLRIAAIALSLNATVVTRNHPDFGQVRWRMTLNLLRYLRVVSQQQRQMICIQKPNHY